MMHQRHLRAAMLLAGAAMFAETMPIEARPTMGALPQGADWVFARTSRGTAMLVYQMPANAPSDLFGTSFTCAQAGMRIQPVLGVASSPVVYSVTLVAGGRRVTLRGRMVATRLENMSDFVTDVMPADSRWMQRFAEVGSMRRCVNGVDMELAGSSAGRTAIRRFLTFCTARK